MLKLFATNIFILLSMSSAQTNASPSEVQLTKNSEGTIAREERKLAIDRCTAAALMLSAAYASYPDDVQLRTDLINRERKLLEDRLGTTDLHLTGAFGPIAFYDGRRIGGSIPKSDPIDTLHLAAEGAASCMAALYDRGALYDRDAVYDHSAL